MLPDPEPKQPGVDFPYLWICWSGHATKVTIKCAAFNDGPLSLTTIFSRPSTLACASVSSLFIAEQYVIVQIYPMPFIHPSADEHLGLSEALLVCSKRTPYTRSLTKNKSFLMGQEARCPGSRWQRQRSREAAFLLYLHEGRNTVSLHGKRARKGHSALPVSLVSSGERHHQTQFWLWGLRLTCHKTTPKFWRGPTQYTAALAQHSGYYV